MKKIDKIEARDYCITSFEVSKYINENYCTVPKALNYVYDLDGNLYELDSKLSGYYKTEISGKYIPVYDSREVLEWLDEHHDIKVFVYKYNSSYWECMITNSNIVSDVYIFSDNLDADITYEMAVSKSIFRVFISL